MKKDIYFLENINQEEEKAEENKEETTDKKAE
jgi:hypothetical protein